MFGATSSGLYAANTARLNLAAPLQSPATGVVTDENGEPLPGASVVVKGTTHGTVTDIDGKYNLPNVANGSTLVISFIGYQTVEMIYQGQPLEVTLQEGQSIEEVIVVGFGTQKKENLTGSVAQVNMSEVLGDRPVINAANALQGALPGLVVSGSSNTEQTKSFSIRGDLSINGGSPLVLIDNVEGDINLLNPEDIESITVLKDAASAAIYGARAAAGVILVTTKRPSKGSHFSLNYNFNQGFERRLNVTQQASLLEYIDAIQESGLNGASWWATGSDFDKWREYVKTYQANPSALAAEGQLFDNGVFITKDGDAKSVYYLKETNINDNMFETGLLSSHNITASGGSDRISFRISAGLNRNNGPLVTKKDLYTRKNVMGFISADITKWFRQEMNISYSDATSLSPAGGTYYSTRLINCVPEGIMPKEALQSGDEDVPVSTPLNNLLLSPTSTTQTAAPRIALRTVITPLKGWTITGEYTHYRNDINYDFYSKPFTIASAERLVTTTPTVGQDRYTRRFAQSRYNALNIFSNFDRTWGKHNFKAMVGFNQENYYYTQMESSIMEQLVQTVPSFGGAVGEKSISERFSEWAIRSVFARFNYSYDNRYLLEVNGRYDGSSKFPTDTRFGLFPSVSVGWRLANESFMDWSDSWLNEFKIRASYGSIGNQNISPYAYYPEMSIGQSNLWINDGKLVTIIGMPGLVSNTFTWEKVTTVNVGLDVSFLSNRLYGSFDWYRRYTSGMLAPGEELPSIVGADAPKQNIADLFNKGWELSLNWRDQHGKFAYNIGFNMFDNQTEIAKYLNQSGLISSYYVGQKLGEIWGYTYDGFYTIDDFDKVEGALVLKEGVTKIQGVNPMPGDYKWVDLDGDGEINPGESTLDKPGDRKIIGNKTARFHYGANIGLSWNGIALDVRMQGLAKRDVTMGGSAIFPFAGSGSSDAKFQPLYYNQTNYWSPISTDPNDPNYMVAKDPNADLFRIYNYQDVNVNSNKRDSRKNIYSGAYFRLKNVTLSYSFPKAWVNKIAMQDAKIYFSVENLATYSSLPKGYDPESFDGAGSLVWAYPFYRTFSVGASITF